MITVEVVYALPERQRLIALRVEDDCSVLAAAQRSGIAREFADIDWATAVLGVFGKIVEQPARTCARDGDRIEIYRPLLIDPKAERRRRAEAKIKRK